MPIFTYFAVIGSALVALLFVADAKLEKHGLVAIGSQVVVLPGAYQPGKMGSTLVTQAAPAPDMDSAAVRAAAPPAPQVAQTTPAPESAPPPAAQTAKAEIAPPKKKHVAHKQQRPRDDDARHYAYRGFDNGPFGGGGGLFGRF